MVNDTMLYQSPLGAMRLAADRQGLVGIWFCGQKYDGVGLTAEYQEGDSPVLCSARQWLELYFAGKEPDFLPPLHLQGTPFQLAVWQRLLEIPYGTTVSYGAIAKELSQKSEQGRMSAQAVGGAVGRNKISIIVPCHRVVGADGSLTGYAGGIDKKQKLLALEGVAFSQTKKRTL